MVDQADHDLLVRIDEQLKGLRNIVEAVILRITRTETDVDSLRLSRAQFYAFSATISTVTGILIKLFWK